MDDSVSQGSERAYLASGRIKNTSVFQTKGAAPSLGSLQNRFSRGFLRRRIPDKHTGNAKPFCDVLGWTFCKTCRQGTQREESFERSASDAANYIFKNTKNRFSPLYQSCIGPYSRNVSENPREVSECCYQEEENVDRMVSTMFPIIYNSMSKRLQITSPTSDEYSESIHNSPSFDSNSVTSLSATISEILDDVNEDQTNKVLCLNKESAVETVDEITIENGPSTQISTIYENWVSEGRPINSDIIKNYEELLEPKNLSNFPSKKIPETSLQGMARRSSLAGQNIRKSTLQNLKNNLDKWQPIFTEEYPRARKKSVAKTSDIQAIRLEKKKDYKREKINVLPNLHGRAGYYRKSILPMEPVKCQIKYIKNRWKDEALFHENDFAIQLDIS